MDRLARDATGPEQPRAATARLHFTASRKEAPHSYGIRTASMTWIEHHRWRALIAARLGEHAQAVSLLREAMAQGLQHTPNLHTEIDLEPIRGDAAYRALMRPAR
jgi:hypothetical protein